MDRAGDPQVKQKSPPFRKKRGKDGAPDCYILTNNYFASTGSTITYLPIEPRSMNLMRPVILAKSVSSLPRPTFRPGFTRVPRCRTMIVPPGTSCPPKALNPSRCAFESRPFREVPCPFLCAIAQFSVLGNRWSCWDGNAARLTEDPASRPTSFSLGQAWPLTSSALHASSQEPSPLLPPPLGLFQLPPSPSSA